MLSDIEAQWQTCVRLLMERHFLCYCNENLTAEDDDDNLMFPYKTEALEDLSDLAKEIGVRIVPVAEY